MNPTIQQGLKLTVVGLSAVAGVGAVVQLASTPFTLKTAWMPLATLVLATSAFSYAMSGQEIRLVPTVGK